MHDDCYFFERDKIIYAMCIDCKEKKFPEMPAFYWDGGFGHKHDVICEECKKVIRKYEKNLY
jgi:hypothetical protein